MCVCVCVCVCVCCCCCFCCRFHFLCVKPLKVIQFCICEWVTVALCIFGVLTALFVIWLVLCETTAISAHVLCTPYSPAPVCCVTLFEAIYTYGACVFSCNMLPALLAGWPGSFTCYCSCVILFSRCQHGSVTAWEYLLCRVRVDLLSCCETILPIFLHLLVSWFCF